MASIGAVRPVFLVVMGVFLAITAWRIARQAPPWTARLLVGGAALLAFGYAFVLPLQEAGRIHPHDVAAGFAWRAVRTFSLNVGWLLLGLGLAAHTGVFRNPLPRRRPVTLPRHESAA